MLELSEDVLDLRQRLKVGLADDERRTPNDLLNKKSLALALILEKNKRK